MIRRWRTPAAVLAAWSLLLQGCYTSMPMQQGPAPVAQRVQLVLNDQGRVSLAQQIGTSADKIEGTVLSSDAQNVTVSVFSVSYFNGASSTWNGEQVHLQNTDVTGYQVRTLNRTKTTIVAAGVTVALVALLFGRSLIGNGGTSTDPGPPPLIGSK